MFLDNKYTKWYNQIVVRAQQRGITTKKQAKEILGYAEDHHIIPDSLGGIDSRHNMVFLTAHEHLVCHLLLIKMTEGTNKAKMVNAAWAMSTLENDGQSRVRITGRTYAKLRKQFAESHSKAMTGYKQRPEQGQKISQALKGKPSKLKGVSRPDIVKNKIAETLRGVPKSDLHKQNIKLTHVGFAGKTATDEHRAKISAKRLATPKLKCPHCAKLADPGNYKRHHGDNCKLLRVSSR